VAVGDATVAHCLLANASAHAYRVDALSVSSDAFTVLPVTLPLTIASNASVRIGVKFAPSLSSAATVLATLQVTMVSLRASRKPVHRKPYVVHLSATVAPALSLRASGALSSVGSSRRHSKLFERAREKQQQQQQQQQPQHQQHDSATAAARDSVVSATNKRTDESFRRLERRLADIESQLGVVLDLMRELHARPVPPPAGLARRSSTSAFNPLLPDDVLDTLKRSKNAKDGGGGGGGEANGDDDDDADDQHSDYSRPFYGSQSAHDRDALRTPPPPDALSVGATKSGAVASHSWRRYIDHVGEFSPTLARMAREFEQQQLQTPARHAASKFADTPNNKWHNDVHDDLDGIAAKRLPYDDNDDGSEEVSF
jgi:hypothetical protein